MFFFRAVMGTDEMYDQPKKKPYAQETYWRKCCSQGLMSTNWIRPAIRVFGDSVCKQIKYYQDLIPPQNLTAMIEFLRLS